MMKLGGYMHCTKISVKFQLGVTAPWVHKPKNVALGYNDGKISAGRLVVNVTKTSQ